MEVPPAACHEQPTAEGASGCSSAQAVDSRSVPVATLWYAETTMKGTGRRSIPRRSVVGREVRAKRARAESMGYASVRREFEAGDVLLFRGRGLASLAIRLLTRSPYSHVGLVFLHDGRVFCFEAVGVGVRLILMSELMRRYHGGIDYYEVLAAATGQRHGAIDFCFRQLGKLYDRPGIIRFLIAIVFNREPAARDDQEWFCSELVAAAYRAQGLALAPESTAYTSPADLALSPELKLRYVLKAE
jgi:Permuted papain-like amidase enzyme, YaeF/YiiX, C92 family